MARSASFPVGNTIRASTETRFEGGFDGELQLTCFEIELHFGKIKRASRNAKSRWLVTVAAGATCAAQVSGALARS